MLYCSDTMQEVKDARTRQAQRKAAASELAAAQAALRDQFVKQATGQLAQGSTKAEREKVQDDALIAADRQLLAATRALSAQLAESGVCTAD